MNCIPCIRLTCDVLYHLHGFHRYVYHQLGWDFQAEPWLSPFGKAFVRFLAWHLVVSELRVSFTKLAAVIFWQIFDVNSSRIFLRSCGGCSGHGSRIQNPTWAHNPVWFFFYFCDGLFTVKEAKQATLQLPRSFFHRRSF